VDGVGTVLGVGLGAPPDAEFKCFGEDPNDRVRGRKLDEALSVLSGLCRGEPFSHHGEYFNVDDVRFVPRVIQTPSVPIWVAGFWPNRAPMRRAARWDGVFPLKSPPVPLVDLAPGTAPWSALWLRPDELGEAVDYVREHRTTNGPFEVIASGGTPLGEKGRAQDIVKSFEEVEATWWLEWLDEQRGTFAQMREHIRQGPPKI
jgi:Luciferase-like monooxygenase